MRSNRSVSVVALCVLTALPMTGCGWFGRGEREIPVGRAAGDGLEAELTIDKCAVHTGDSVQVNLTIRNTDDADLTIVAASAAKMLVSLWRHDPFVGWKRIREYPEVAAAVVIPWSLAAGDEKTFTMRVPVEPDWPVREELKLSAEMNGRPNVRPELPILVLPREPSTPE